MKKFFSTVIALSLFAAIPVSATSYPVGGYQYYLAGAGVTSSATTIQLTSFKTPDGRNITMSMFGGIGYGALDPQTTSKIENITFTGVTQNSNGTALLTGVTRGVDFVTPYAASSTLRRSHTGGSTFILTNTASYYGEQFGMVNNPSVVTDYWTFPEPISPSNPTTKNYVDNLVNGGTITSSAVIGPGVAGETLTAGNIVYLNTSDARWYKADTDIQNSIYNSMLAVAQGAGTSGNTITGGVLLKGVDTNQSGLVAGANYFVSSTAGSLTSATTSKPVGKARTTTSIYFDPYFTGFAVTNATNTFSQSNTFTSTTTFTSTSTTFIGSFPAYQIGLNSFISSTTGTSTFAIPSGIKKLWVEVQGAGGDGGSCTAGASNSSGGGGGGAGGYSQEVVDVSGTTSVQYYLGTDRTTFGTPGFAFLEGKGGSAGAETTPGTGGTASGGDINISGSTGSGGAIDIANNSGGDPMGGTGASSPFGGEGGGAGGANVAGAAATGFGSGGGGASCSNGSANGGTGALGILIIRW